ncbi:MAG: RNA-binding cell elongation regulator Jag/EloR [Elusimicrobiota bacterium]
MNDKREFKGKDVEAAIKKGLDKLNLDKEEVEVKILDGGKAGLFGLMGSKPAKVQLIKKNEHSDAADTDINWDKTVKKTTELVKLITDKIDTHARIETEKDESEVKVEIFSENSGVMIGKKGTTLKDFQYIVNLMLKREPDTRVNVNIDIENYKSERNSKLFKKLGKTIEKVKKDGKPRKLKPMNSSTRKIIHKKVKNIDGVISESEGAENRRRVLIKKSSN